MFTQEPERQETPAERDLRRASTGTDRKGLHHVMIAMTIIFGGMALIVAADVAGVERRLTNATVVGLVDRWNMKGGHECVTLLKTGYGEAQIFTRNLCHYAPWHLGDSAEVEARQSRFTRTILVGTSGTIFDEARGRPPRS